MAVETHEFAAPTSSKPLGCIECGYPKDAPVHKVESGPPIELARLATFNGAWQPIEEVEPEPDVHNRPAT